MKKIDLKEYKKYKTYFVLFDILMKENKLKKEELLKELNISISSYRRAHLNDTKISKELYIKLCNYFNIIPIDLKDIDYYEEKLNSIYFDNYYGIDNKLEENFKWLEEQKNKRNVFFPIFQMLEQYYKFEEMIIDENEMNFLKYKKFYQGELLEFCKIFEITLTKESYDPACYDYNNDYNENYLSALALNSFKNNKYIESIYYAEKAIELYEINLNYKRKYAMNIIIMINLLSIKKYGDCAKLAHKQYYSLKSLEYYGDEFNSTLEIYFLSNLYLNNYNEIVSYEYASYETSVILCIRLYAYKRINDNKGYIDTLNKIKNSKFNSIIEVYNEDLLDFNYDFAKKLLSIKVGQK